MSSGLEEARGLKQQRQIEVHSWGPPCNTNQNVPRVCRESVALTRAQNSVRD